jgi:hypothetical protein
MKQLLRRAGATAALVLVVSIAHAQDIDLSQGGADQIWRGTVAGANAGRWLDAGPLSPGDNRRDLVIGAPGNASVAGKMYVIFAGPVPTGDLSLASANVVISGSSAGDQFGASAAVGPINVLSTNMTSNLAVGAPGALGGRGAVYLFSTPMSAGALTTANAVFIVEGAAGDQLGAALATADIDNDGYREIVIGAPGNNRVYVIKGSATLSGTHNLALTAANFVINGTGIGRVLQAGDLTNDGVYEIVIGSPVMGAVYLLTGTYPTVSNLPADADAVFSGIDIGDAAGASLRIADLDADGVRDLVIGAPGGNGPDNSRPNAGEAYVLWGRPSFASMSLAGANVTFYGAAASDELGDGVTAGDINRDIPNDVVFLVPFAGGAGELYIYYGGPRSQFGTDLGGGRRVVDFASTPPHRRIIGDPASGQILAAAVHEVTGEGARDIIVGVPGNDGSRGAAFFTISPKLIAEPSTLSVSLPAGAETNRGIVLQNASPIPISWAVSVDRSWLAPWPLSGESLAGSFGSFTLYLSAVGMAPGTYTGTLTFRSTSHHLDMSKAVAVTLTVTCGYGISPASVSVGAEGTTGSVTLTTQSGCGWNAASNSSFLAITSTASGSGSATVSYSVAANTSVGSRTGTATIAGQTFTVVQAGAPADPARRARENARADFNGDGRSDLLWQDMTHGYLAVWTLEGHRVKNTLALSHFVPGNDWRIVGTGDFNGDGKPDIVWHHRTQGWLYLWYMNGTTRIGETAFSETGVADTQWQVMAVGDMNGDHKPDLVWQHQTQRWLAVWQMDGKTVQAALGLTPSQVSDAAWQVTGLGDFNGDGHNDLVLRHSANGQVQAWFMNGRTRVETVSLTPGVIPDANWKITAIIDANADTQPDIVWHHATTGMIIIWYMNGVTQTSDPIFSESVPTNWKIVGPK